MQHVARWSTRYHLLGKTLSVVLLEKKNSYQVPGSKPKQCSVFDCALCEVRRGHLRPMQYLAMTTPKTLCVK